MIPLLILLVTTLLATGAQATGRRVCYYTNWSQYRLNGGKYLPEHINATLCTHIAIAFAKMTDILGPYEWNDESTQSRSGTFEQIVDLKKTNPDLKILLSIGGWNAHSLPFDEVLKSPYKTQKFAKQAAYYIRSQGMDGLDVDWEYPINKSKYSTFIKILKDAFITEAHESGRQILLLTAAVPAGKANIDRGFDVPLVAKLMDFITVMTYDLHGSWERVTGHHSAMYAGHWEKGLQRHLNVDWIINYWLKLGVPKSKLTLGVPTYGRCFTLQSAFRTGVNVPTISASKAGKATAQGGFLAYYEMCEMLQKGAVKKYIAEQKVSYLVLGDQWCGFDDTESLKTKVKYIKSMGFGGIAIWSIDLDDFSGHCGPKYPLLTTIFNEMEGNKFPTVASPEKEPPTSTDYKGTRMLTSDVWVYSRTTSTMKPVKTTTQPRTTAKIDTDPCVGKIVGFLPDPKDCQKFWMCSNGIGFIKTCPRFTMWNQVYNICDWENNVICSPSSQI